jgi:hypothetical protein
MSALVKWALTITAPKHYLYKPPNIKKMNQLLNQHKETILTWINSCEKSDQLKLLIHVIYEFIGVRFAGKVTKQEIDDAKLELFSAVEEKEMAINMGVWDDSEKFIYELPNLN